MSMRKQKEVQKMSSWKRVGIAAVVSVSLICSIPAYAKGKPDSPGKSRNAPGLSGDSPGKSGDVPGQLKQLIDAPISDEEDVKNSREDYLEDFLNSDDISLGTPVARWVISNSSEHEKLKTEMEIILLAYKTGLIAKEDAEVRTKKCLDKMEEVTESGKFLGFMFRCRGMLCQ